MTIFTTVKDDGFGEDRQVLQSHRSGTVASLLRATALNLLRGCCLLWKPSEPCNKFTVLVSSSNYR